MKLVVTVGTFGFGELIDKIVESIGPISKKYTELAIQYGQTEPASLKKLAASKEPIPVSLEKTPYYTSFEKFTQGASMVISHAGTGTVLSLLKSSTPFIVVPNQSLLGDHQTEYADSLRDCIRVSSLSSVVSDALQEQHTAHTVEASSSLWATHFAPLLK